MHPHLTAVLAGLDESRGSLVAAIDAVPAPLRTRRPASDRWSVAEILEHLSLVEARFASILATRIEEAVQAGLGPETGSRLPLPDALAQRLADRVNRRNAPETAVPTGTLDYPAALAAAGRARAAVRDAVSRADGLALGTVTYTHDFFGELTIYQWLELIARHERRHAEQIDELRGQLAAASAP